ncbi:MAG: acyl carrier protein [Hyphomicrobiaceae bacterium]|nr:acyl carrier protein [Hyphomicrobiaceae bacterium]
MMSAVATSDGVRPEIIAIFAEVFEHEAPISIATSPGDVARWDSLNHVALVSMIERTFGIGLSMDEMIEIQSVGDIQRLLARHGV